MGGPPSGARSFTTTERVLVVEDDPLLNLALREQLGAQGFEVRAVADGLEAIHALRDTAFDALLLDLGIPHLSGVELLERLRCAIDLAPLPTVVLTGADGAELKRTDGPEVFSILRKPASTRKIAGCLRAAIRFG